MLKPYSLTRTCPIPAEQETDVWCGSQSPIFWQSSLRGPTKPLRASLSQHHLVGSYSSCQAFPSGAYFALCCAPVGLSSL